MGRKAVCIETDRYQRDFIKIQLYVLKQCSQSQRVREYAHTYVRKGDCRGRAAVSDQEDSDSVNVKSSALNFNPIHAKL